VRGDAVDRVHGHAELLEQARVGQEARGQVDAARRQRPLVGGPAGGARLGRVLAAPHRDAHVRGLDRRHARVPHPADRALAQPRRHVGEHPRLDVRVEPRAEVDHRHARAGAVQLERRVHRRVAAADHHDLLLEAVVPLVEVVRHVRQLLARHAQPARRAEVARGDHHRAGPPAALGPARRARPDREPRAVRLRAVRALDADHLLVLPHVQPEVRRDGPVVRQRVAPRRLLRRHRERHAADRDPLGRGEEGHVGRVRGHAAHQAPAVEHDRAEPCPPRGDGRREPARARAHDQQVDELFGHPHLAGGGRRAPAPPGRPRRPAPDPLRPR
jgi:hypothetical protein